MQGNLQRKLECSPSPTSEQRLTCLAQLLELRFQVPEMFQELRGQLYQNQQMSQFLHQVAAVAAAARATESDDPLFRKEHIAIEKCKQR